MDLKNMLNEAHGQRGPQAQVHAHPPAPPPRLYTASSHTPQSSYDARMEQTPLSDVISARTTPYGPLSHQGHGDPRAGSASSHGGQGHGQFHATQTQTQTQASTPGGGYFAMQAQSPYPPNHSASTPAGGPHSAHLTYVQSPGQGNYGPPSHTPRSEHINGSSIASYSGQHPGQSNASFVPPSPSNHPPVTPSASSHQPNQHHYAGNNYHPVAHQFQSPPPPQANGLPPSQVRQISPHGQHQSQPVTPLGPPIGYPRASPQTNRPPSQGHPGYQDLHLRRASQSSVGSHSSRDPSRSDYQQPPPPQHQHQHPQPLPPQQQQYNSPQAQQHVDHQYQHKPIQPPSPQATPIRRDSIQGQSYYQERERSESVSPKTIPRPPPHRSQSSSSQLHSQPPSHNPSVSSQSHSQIQPQSQPGSQPQPQPPPQIAGPSAPPIATQSQIHSSPYQVDPYQQRPPPPSRMLSQPSSVGSQPQAEPSPVMKSKVQPPPRLDRDPSSTPSNRRSIPPESAMAVDSPRDKTPIKIEPNVQSLKRRASHMSATQAPPPPKKRARHDVPVWARSARVTMHGQQRPLHFVQARPRVARHHKMDHRPQPQQQQPQQQHQARQNHGPSNGSAPPRSGPARHSQESGYEASIAGIQPYENITRRICEWIISLMSNYAPPPGAHYEIEAKIGRIFDRNTEERLGIQWIDSEVLLDTSKIQTKFKSNMTRYHHQALNEYLNSLVQEKQQRRQHDPSVQTIGYSHPKENDEFFMLNEDGRRSLPPPLLSWLNEHPDHEFRDRFRRRNEFKVRRTIDKSTGRPSAQIIKIRIGDKDIFNPDSDFDYRISISLEVPWDGRQEHLEREVSSRGRNKDRMSYRHQMYQVDLTQVSHSDDPNQLEHELEIEIGDFVVQQDLRNVQKGDGGDFQIHIKGLIDNARLLCRKGSNVPMDPKIKQQEGW